jgi:hypothetical protein
MQIAAASQLGDEQEQVNEFAHGFQCRDLPFAIKNGHREVFAMAGIRAAV